MGGRGVDRRRTRLLGIVVHPNILAPLPDIPQHVVQAPGIRFLAGDGMGLIAAVLAVPGDGVEVFRVTRRLRPRAAGIFPLGFRRKRERKVDLFKPELFVDCLNKFRQSSQVTFSTGRSGDLNSLGFSPITASQSAWVQGVSNIQKPSAIVTSCCGPSSEYRPSSSGGEPIRNRPGGIQRRRWRTGPSGASGGALFFFLAARFVGGFAAFPSIVNSAQSPYLSRPMAEAHLGRVVVRSTTCSTSELTRNGVSAANDTPSIPGASRLIQPAPLVVSRSPGCSAPLRLAPPLAPLPVSLSDLPVPEP